MKRILASSIAALSFAAAAQAPSGPAGAPPRSDVLQACSDCGEVRSIRRVEREPRAPNALPEPAPSGLVASIPLGGGKTTVGSSTREERLRDPPLVTYEVIVRLEDGRVRIVVQDEEPVGLKMGDRVRVEENKVRPR
jgi:outer membrane lipoprotein SlyB